MGTDRGAPLDQRIEHVDGTTLAAHWARPSVSGSGPALVLCHDFPTPPRGSVASGLTFPEFADRIAAQVGWRVLTFNFQGTGGSEGDFSIAAWARDIAAVDAVSSARAFAPRPLLLLHGTDDDVVSVADAELLADAHGGAELRIVENAGRRLRHDPRAVASVLGWLDRQVI